MRVHFQVVEGSRRRTQVFEGIVLRRQGSGARETFTVRKQSFGVGVERTFPLHSPKIEKLEIAARGDVRRAKLYYLRGRIGKAARVAERRWGIDEELISAPAAAAEPEAVDAEGVSQERGRAGRGRRRRGRGRRGDVRGGAPRREAAPRPRRRRRGRGRGEPAERRGERRRLRRRRRRTRRRPRPGRPRTAAAPEDAEDEEPARSRRLRRGLGLKLSIPKPKSQAGGLIELVVIVALALGLALAIQAWLVKPYQIPSRVDGADARRRPAGPRQPLPLPLQRPAIGDIVVFHPPAGRRQRAPNAASRQPQPRARPARSRPTEESSQNFIKRIVAGPGRHARGQRRPPGRQRGREDRRALHQPLRQRPQPAICRSRSRFHPTITS